ncbi:MAG: helix-turn-helix transcriptional regulator [Oscillospiraceae bacterium]|nr:helix-turn-helix transcriptional regulator [Oscillospiraceae bacterium]
MNADFSRVLSLLRQEKGISQRRAAAALGISQALLSHYENGIREPGLNFVTKACDYYHVSADYLLGRSLSRDGAMIEAEELADASEGKEDMKGSMMAKLQKKLLVNTASVLFDLLGRTNNKEAVAHAGEYLSGALYQMFRLLYRAAGGNEGYFSTGCASFNMDIMSADMTLARVRYAKALEEYKGEYPPMDSQSLAEEYQGLSQSIAQVLHNADERVKKLEE